MVRSSWSNPQPNWQPRPQVCHPPPPPAPLPPAGCPTDIVLSIHIEQFFDIDTFKLDLEILGVLNIAPCEYRTTGVADSGQDYIIDITPGSATTSAVIIVQTEIQTYDGPVPIQYTATPTGWDGILPWESTTVNVQGPEAYDEPSANLQFYEE